MKNKYIGPGISLNWCRYHGRSDVLARKLGIKQFYVFPNSRNIFMRYIKSTSETIRIIIKEKPKYIIVMQPPVFVLILVFLISKLVHLRIIGDLHTGVFLDPKWHWSTKIVISILGGNNCSIVTNNSLEDRIRIHGNQNVVVLDDLIENYECEIFTDETSELLIKIEKENYILVPLAYAYDEPLDELFRAISIEKHLLWVLTGDAPEIIKKKAPSNIIFTGYVSNAQYRSLLLKSSAVLALTTREYTMQRAGYEAMCAGKPLVISNKKVLINYFGDAAVYVENTPHQIYRGARLVLEEMEMYGNLMKNRRALKLEVQDTALQVLRNYLNVGN